MFTFIFKCFDVIEFVTDKTFFPLFLIDFVFFSCVNKFKRILNSNNNSSEPRRDLANVSRNVKLIKNLSQTNKITSVDFNLETCSVFNIPF